MSDSLFPPEFAKYGLTFDFAAPADSLVALVATCWTIHNEITSASEAKSEDSPTHPYDVKAGKDKAAAKVASDLLDAFLTQCDAAIAKNPNVAWHLAQTDSSVTQYLTSEMQYFRVKEAPARPVTSGSKLETLREDRKVLTQTARKMIDAFPTLANDPRLVKEDGKVKLPNLQGAGNRSADVPTGRYAKLRQSIWSVDGQDFPVGTDPREILRAIYVGRERVGKKVADIFDPIDKARKSAKTMDTPVNVKINGKLVGFRMTESDDAK